MSKPKQFVSWNPRAQRYVLTIEGKKGVQDMLKEPPENAVLKNCTGTEHLSEKDNEKEIENSVSESKKVDSGKSIFSFIPGFD